MHHDIVVIAPDGAAGEPLWLTCAGGKVVARLARPPHVGEDARGAMRCALILPVGMTMVHHFVLPGMTARQGEAVARRKAVDASIGGAEALHVIAAPCAGRPDTYVAVTIDRAVMADMIGWIGDHGFDPDFIVPAGLLLPEPEEGFARARIGAHVVARGAGMCLSAEEPFAAAIMADMPVRDVPGDEVDALFVHLSDARVPNLRAGDFAPAGKGADQRAMVRRAALWLAFAALAMLLTTLVQIARFHLDARGHDARTLAMARAHVGQVDDPVMAERAMAERVAERGAGGAGFTGPMAALVRAMQGSPSVSITLLSRDPDGMIHASLASARAQDINQVLLAIQAAGFTITATSSADTSGRVVAQITVRS